MSEKEDEVRNLLRAAHAMELDELRSKIEAGESDAILDALWVAIRPDAVMPDWLAVRLSRAVMDYKSSKTRTLDEAFGISRPKSYPLKARRERWEKAGRIVRDAVLLHRHHVPFGDAMFQALGEIHGVGKSRAAQYFYFHKDRRTNTFYAASHAAETAELSEKLEEVLTSLKP